MGKTLTIIAIILFTSCSVTNEPGVVLKTKNARIVKGNAKKFQLRNVYVQQHNKKEKM